MRQNNNSIITVTLHTYMMHTTKPLTGFYIQYEVLKLALEI